MGNMSASDAAPLPRLGEVFFDVRGSARSLRLSWYADTSVAVFSIWQAGTCTGTFRLPMGDLARMIETLQRGPDGLPARDQAGQQPGYLDPEPGYPDAEPGYGAATESWYGGWDDQDGPWDGRPDGPRDARADGPRDGRPDGPRDARADGPPARPGHRVSGGYPARTGAVEYRGGNGGDDYSAVGYSADEHSGAGYCTDDYRADGYGADGYGAGRHGVDADGYGADRYGADADRYGADRYGADDYSADDYSGDYACDGDYAGDRTQAHYLPAPAHSGYASRPGRSADVDGAHNGGAVRGPVPRGRPPESFPYGPLAAPER